MNIIHIYKYTDSSRLVKQIVNIFHVDRVSPYDRLYVMGRMSLGEKIRLRRKEVGLTAEALAKRVGVDRTYLSKIERHHFLPSPEVFKNIDKILDLGPDFRKRYIQKKYPDFGEVLKAVIEEHKAHPEVAEEEMRKFMERDKEMNSRLVAIKIIKQYNPSQAKNEALINRLIKGLKNLQKKESELINLARAGA